MVQICQSKIILNFGGRHSSVDQSGSTMVQTRVRFPSTTSTLFQLIFELRVKRTKIKEDGIGILKKRPDRIIKYQSAL